MKGLLVVALLSASAFAADTTVAAGVQAACGPDAVRFNVRALGQQQFMPQVEPGKALVYVIEEYDRPVNEVGKPTVRLGMDGTWVGANRSGSFFFVAVEPGAHHLCADWQSAPPWIAPRPSFNYFTAEAGQVYFLRARVIDHGRGVWTLDLEQVNGDEGRYLVTTLPLSQSTPRR